MNNRYYTTTEGIILIWHPGVEVRIGNESALLAGSAWELREYFRAPEPMVYVPFEIVRVLTDGI